MSDERRTDQIRRGVLRLSQRQANGSQRRRGSRAEQRAEFLEWIWLKIGEPRVHTVPRDPSYPAGARSRNPTFVLKRHAATCREALSSRHDGLPEAAPTLASWTIGAVRP